MGLDMYLYKRRQTNSKRKDPLERAIQWRKANAIHRWFVAYVQHGVDECKEFPVTRLQLTWLLDLCEKVQSDHSRAVDLLPTQEGFFFGPTEYDDYYFEKIAYTQRELQTLLEEPGMEYVYRSSW